TVRGKYSLAFPQCSPQTCRCELIENHVRHNEIERSIWKRETPADVQNSVFGFPNAEMAPRYAKQHFRLVCNDDTGWNLSRKSPQYQGKEVAVPCSDFQDRRVGDTWKLTQHQIVEGQLLKSTAVCACHGMPLFGNMIVVRHHRPGAFAFGIMSVADADGD